MTYKTALNLKPGDKVAIKATGEPHTVRCIEGTTQSIFVILDSGDEYRHDQLRRKAGQALPQLPMLFAL